MAKRPQASGAAVKAKMQRPGKCLNGGQGETLRDGHLGGEGE